jgi:hypothetical protein
VKYGDGGVHIDAKNVSYGSMTLLNQQPNLRIEPRAAVRINDESNKILPAGKYIVGMVGYARYGQKRQIQPRVWLLKPASIVKRAHRNVHLAAHLVAVPESQFVALPMPALHGTTALHCTALRCM